jgi:hypothetical protein
MNIYILIEIQIMRSLVHVLTVFIYEKSVRLPASMRVQTGAHSIFGLMCV